MKNVITILSHVFRLSSCIMCLISFTCTVIAQTNCPNLFKCGDTLIDLRDGYHYPTIKLGTQCWFKVNLQTTKYINGDAIPNITDANIWGSPTYGGWCDYNNDPANGVIYGHMYNPDALFDNRGLCPTGWYVPTENEWNILFNYLGGISVAGGVMKSTTPDWILPNVGATNSSGFTALPGGQRPYTPAQFISFGTLAQWHTSSLNGSNLYWMAAVGNNSANASLDNWYHINDGNYIRCIKDY